MQANADPKPGAERHGEAENRGGIAEIIPRSSAAPVIISVLPAQKQSFQEI
jgi:hypothetical protein